MLRLRELRTGEELTQKQLAQKIGYEAHNIGDWERGKAEPSIVDLIKLADVFGCSVDYLIGRADDFDTVKINYDNTPDEKFILTTYKTLPENMKEFIFNTVLSFKQWNEK